MKTFKITITYEVTDEAYIEARTEAEALELARTGAADWSLIDNSPWLSVEAEELED